MTTLYGRHGDPAVIVYVADVLDELISIDTICDGIWFRNPDHSYYRIPSSEIVAQQRHEEFEWERFIDDLLTCIVHYGYAPEFAFKRLYDGYVCDFNWEPYPVCVSKYRPLYITNVPELMEHGELKKWILIADAITSDKTTNEEMKGGAYVFLKDALPILSHYHFETLYLGAIIPEHKLRDILNGRG